MRTPPICVTVTGRTMEEVRRKRDESDLADMVEIRLDGVDRPDAAGALAGRRRPVVVTCRPQWEGGTFSGSEEERLRILAAAIDLGAEFVDVEAAAAFARELIDARNGRGIVLSTHFFTGIPGDLEARYAAMRSTGAEVVKIAASAGRLTDLLQLFAVAESTPGGRDEPPHILIAMGEAGVPSRLLSRRLRNRWTYAGDGVAPGQLPAERLLAEYRIDRMRADSSLYGVVGNPVAQSLSPSMHNAGFAALGLNAAYLPLQAADAEDFVGFAKRMRLRGASITAPFKIALMAAMDDIDPLARRVGAVNTLVVRDGRWIGFNTDVEGFIAPLANRIALPGVRATVLGAGGAARAVALGLAERGAVVTISSRRPEAAARLAKDNGVAHGDFPPPPGSWDVLVNATPAGSAASPVNPIAGTPLDGRIVYDLVYSPARTPLLDAAGHEGCTTIGGLEMLVAQAERQFELWTGQRPPSDLFTSSAERALALREHQTARTGAL